MFTLYHVNVGNARNVAVYTSVQEVGTANYFGADVLVCYNSSKFNSRHSMNDKSDMVERIVRQAILGRETGTLYSVTYTVQNIEPAGISNSMRSYLLRKLSSIPNAIKVDSTHWVINSHLTALELWSDISSSLSKYKTYIDYVDVLIIGVRDDIGTSDCIYYKFRDTEITKWIDEQLRNLD